MRIHHFLAAVLAGIVLVAPHNAPAQEPPKEPGDNKKPMTRVNILPMGDFPVSGAVIKNDRPVMVEPKPSELIPTPVFIKEGKVYKALCLSMNTPSESWQRPSGSVLNILKQKEGEYQRFITITLPDGKDDLTVFLLRNQRSKSWTDEPRAMIFKNGIETFPLGSARMINFSSVPITVTMGPKAQTIPPQSVKVFGFAPTANGKRDQIYFTYRITARIKNVDMILANTAVAYDKQSRVNLVTYDRDGDSEIKIEGDDRPVKIVKYFELPYQPPSAAPAAPAATAPVPATQPG